MERELSNARLCAFLMEKGRGGLVIDDKVYLLMARFRKWPNRFLAIEVSAELQYVRFVVVKSKSDGGREVQNITNVFTEADFNPAFYAPVDFDDLARLAIAILERKPEWPRLNEDQRRYLTSTPSALYAFVENAIRIATDAGVYREDALRRESSFPGRRPNILRGGEATDEWIVRMTAERMTQIFGTV